MPLSDKLRKDFDILPTHPHILDLARRVHPTWVAAHGHKEDRGIELLASEIAQCVVAARYLIEENGNDAGRRYVVGHGIIVSIPPQEFSLGADNFDVAVVAGTFYSVQAEPRVT